MKLKFFLFACFLFAINESFASHNRGGRIDVCWMHDLTYEITITTYTRTSSITADRPSLDSVYVGLGQSMVFYRSSKIDIGNDISINTYVNSVYYPGDGTYLIHFTDPNLNAGICNVPSSVSIPFYLEAEFVISNFSCPVCSPQALCPTLSEFPIGKDIHSCHASYSETRDSISYILVPCQSGPNQPIVGYTIPFGASINPYSGEFFWDQSQYAISDTCVFDFAVRTDYWRKGVYFGHTFENFLIHLESSLDTNYSFQNTSSLPLTPQGFYSSAIPAGDTFNIQIDFSDINNPPTLNRAHEPQILPSFNSTTVGSLATGTLTWITTISDAHYQPTTFVFRGLPSGNDLTYLLYVTGSNNDTCTTIIGIDDVIEKSLISVYPNPSNDFLNIHLENFSNKNSKLSLIDINGKIIFKSYIRSPNMIIDVRQFASGIYVLRYDDGENVFFKKIIHN